MLNRYMDPDFTALASRVAARAEVLGCVILSRDGLVLGSFPPNGEGDITPGLLRFAQLGDPERGFVQFPDEVWAYVTHGSYAAFAVAGAGTRPGILIDYLEQALEVAGDARITRFAVSEPLHVDLSPKVARIGRGLRATSNVPAEELRASVTAAPPIREAPPLPSPGFSEPITPFEPPNEPTREEPFEAPREPNTPFEPLPEPPREAPVEAPRESTTPFERFPEPSREAPVEEPREPASEARFEPPTEPPVQSPRDPVEAPSWFATPGKDATDELAKTLAESVSGEDNDPPDADEGGDVASASDHAGPFEAEVQTGLVIGEPPGIVPEGFPTFGEHEGARIGFDRDAGDFPGAGDGSGDSHALHEGAENPEEIDRVALAREFAQLLQDAPASAEDSD
ncbi:MAG: hypothetical protein ACJ77A_14520 [Actinomycetota bacterium]